MRAREREIERVRERERKRERWKERVERLKLEKDETPLCLRYAPERESERERTQTLHAGLPGQHGPAAPSDTRSKSNKERMKTPL